MSAWIRSMLSGLGMASKRVQVGRDITGNVYYTLPQLNPSRHSPSGIERRLVLPPSGNEFDFDQSTVPRLWATWLSGGRVHPPTPDELAAEVDRVSEMAVKVQELEAKERSLDALTDAASGETYLNHASAKEFSSPTSSSKPGTGAGGVFRPGAWGPTTPADTNSSRDGDVETEASTFKPTGWAPGSKS
eukprot:m.24914 g.24914  ORF g.24914 m.24914 type:complete len:189 (-) comp11365_c0_seq2:2468-3034(-)